MPDVQTYFWVSVRQVCLQYADTMVAPCEASRIDHVDSESAEIVSVTTVNVGVFVDGHVYSAQTEGCYLNIPQRTPTHPGSTWRPPRELHRE